MKTVAVFFGGQSVEHDISIITGVLTLNSLDKEKYIPFPVYIDKSGAWFTGKQLFDLDNYKALNYKALNRVTMVAGDNTVYAVKKSVVKKLASLAVGINCLHGERGEDGSLVGLLNMCGVPLASPTLAPSAVCMDKALTKVLLKGIGIKTLNCFALRNESEINDCEKRIKFPVIVKPNKLGSSIGISKAKDIEQLKRAVLFGLKYGESVIVEPLLKNFVEINCAAYRDYSGSICVSECERPVSRTDILTFTDKYENGKREFPADISEQLSDEIKRTTEKIYKAFDCRGVIRIDFFISGGKIYVNEINTVPGSLAYYLFSDTLKGFTNILNELIGLAEKEFASSSTVVKTYCSGVLSVAGAKGGKRK